VVLFWENVSMAQIIESKTIYTVRMTVTINWWNKVMPKNRRKEVLNGNVGAKN
jgi:hypothetical protein